MDFATKNYRLDQFSKVSPPLDKYKAKIKISTSEKATNWLNITTFELQQVIKILTSDQTAFSAGQSLTTGRGRKLFNLTYEV